MACPPEVAAALSGATMRQLTYWRSGDSSEPLLAPQTHRFRSRVFYSFKDVLALRTFVYLRTQGVSLQRIRRAVKSLRAMGETEHLAQYRLMADGRDVVWRVSDEEAITLTGRPGQRLIATMVDILDGFMNMGRPVVPLYVPAPGLRIDPDVRGGYPVIEGTRVPFDLVAGLVRDGVPPGEVSAFYPAVDAAAACGAAEFARHVGEWAKPAAAA